MVPVVIPVAKPTEWRDTHQKYFEILTYRVGAKYMSSEYFASYFTFDILSQSELENEPAEAST